MKEVPVREIKLAAEERRESYVEDGRVAAGDIPARTHKNRKPINSLFNRCHSKKYYK